MLSQSKSKYAYPLWWFGIKFSLAATLCIFIINIVINRNSLPFPTGICLYVDFSFLLYVPVKCLMVILLIIFVVLYILEKKMLLSLFMLSIFSILFFSIEESNGNTAENGILSLIFLSQFVTYFFINKPGEFNYKYYRVQFPAQVIAANYTLSALSKLNESGVSWFLSDSPKLSLEIMRFYYGEYISTGNALFAEQGNKIAQFMLDTPIVLSVLLGMTLLLELCSFVLIINSRLARRYAAALLFMHLGIYIVLKIFFPVFILPLIIIFFNPLYYFLNYCKVMPNAFCHIIQDK